MNFPPSYFFWRNRLAFSTLAQDSMEITFRKSGDSDPNSSLLRSSENEFVVIFSKLRARIFVSVNAALHFCPPVDGEAPYP